MILAVLLVIFCIWLGTKKIRCKHVWDLERDEVHPALFNPREVWMVREFRCIKCNKKIKEENVVESH